MTRLAPLFALLSVLAACSLADSGWVVPPPVPPADDDDSAVSDDDDSSVPSDDDDSAVADDDDSSAGDDDSATSDDDDSTPPGAVDADGDGYTPVVDCDDSDPAVNPGAAETSNGIDDNCNGQIDEGFDPDQDGDGYSPEPDCDDSDPAVYPGATEVCNSIDDDCDGSVDEGGVCSTEQTLTVSVEYPTAYPSLVLTVQPIFSVGDIGDYWVAPAVSWNSNLVSWLTTDDFSGLLGVLLNVNVDQNGDFSADDWYCYGHYSTASLEAAVIVNVNLGVDAWDQSDLLTWSPGTSSQTSLGCAGLLWFVGSPAITEGYVGG